MIPTEHYPCGFERNPSDIVQQWTIQESTLRNSIILSEFGVPTEIITSIKTCLNKTDYSKLRRVKELSDT
jgi:hypothetical protein